MDESKTCSNGPAPFLTKTYEMVDDPVTNSLVSWSRSGYSFVVWNPPDFATDLLPKYFKHNNFSSFVRQLNTYGFRKIDPEQWEFANEEFIRGRTHLLKNIYRRKPVHSHSALNQVTENERNEFEGKIERLKKDKTLLQLELKRRESENQGLEFQVQCLCERLQNLECRQMQLMNLFAKLLKKPGFAFAVMQQSQVDNKRRRLLKPSYDDQKVLSLEQIDKLESSLNFWASFVYGIGEVFSEEVYDFGVLPQLCVGVTEEDVSYKEPCSPTSHLYSTHSTPAEPASASASASASSVPTKVNDVFWEQLLMEETPDSANTKETFL